MEPRLNLVVATLEGLDVALSTKFAEERRLMQSAIYLSQVLAFDLGYNFVWHAVGPFSTDLADDYYEASCKLRVGYQVRPLRTSIRNRLRDLKVALVMNEQVDRKQWLPLLAAVHFLKHSAKLEDEQIIAMMSSKTDNVISLIPKAQIFLERVALAS